MSAGILIVISYTLETLKNNRKIASLQRYKNFSLKYHVRFSNFLIRLFTESLRLSYALPLTVYNELKLKKTAPLELFNHPSLDY